MVTRGAARAAKAVSAVVTKGAGQTTKSLGKQQIQQTMEKSREDAYDGDSASSSELSSLSSQSEFELSEEEGKASKYFQPPSPVKVEPDIRKRKRTAAAVKRGQVVKKEPIVKKEAIKREPSPSLGDIVPAIIKHEQKKKGKGKANNVIKTEPPPHWEEMYDAVKEMRSRIPAPVDTMGCERLADGASTPKIRRFQTLISLMLSSQTKDTVNAVAMKQLQTELPGGLCLESILAVEPKRLDELIRIVGFHNRKTEYIKKAAIILRDQFDGEIPDTLEGLTSLPGVGPKMAHLCMSAAWNNTQGIGVDVHVHRITNMWGWVNTTTPEGTREALEAWLPRDRWREINHLLVGFGQSVCLPRGRKCGECSLAETGWCRAAWAGVPKARRTVVVVKDEDGLDGVKEEVKIEEEDFGIKMEERDVKTEETDPEARAENGMVIKTENGGRPKRGARGRRSTKKEPKHYVDTSEEEASKADIKPEPDSPDARRPITRKRRKIKVEIKEEDEDDDGMIADIEDIIPNLKSPR